MENDPEKKINVPPIISVVLPVYNGEKHLTSALESILCQTFCDFELIVIDDGSSDGTFAILQEYQVKDKRVHLISRKNKGLIATLNEGIDYATGQWIARMDCDDIALPHRFERQLDWLEKTGADICGTWVRRFGSMDKRVVRLLQTDEEIKTEMLFCSPFAHPTVMMRRDLAKQLRYDSSWENAEDYDLWERAAKAGYKMTNVPEVLLMYRLHVAQVSIANSLRQHQLTQEIRRRYWIYVSNELEIDFLGIEDILKIHDPGMPMVNLKYVEIALAALLKKKYGESRKVILNHALRLYLRIAADCPDITSRWNKLNADVDERATISDLLKLWVLHHFGVRQESKMFKFLKNLHILLVQKT
jgi:glycosyltransferase involved in cell wall biosynthesis